MTRCAFPLVTGIVSAVESAVVVVGGMSAIGAPLYSIGIPKDSVLRYEKALKADKYLLVVNGTSDEAARARDILRSTRAASVDEHPSQPAAA